MADSVAPPQDLWKRSYRNPEPVEGIHVLAVINDNRQPLRAQGELQIGTVGSQASGISARIDIDLTPAQMRAVAACLLAQADYLDSLIVEVKHLNAAPAPQNPGYAWPDAIAAQPTQPVEALA